MSNYEIFSTLTALISVTVSLVVIVWARKLSDKQSIIGNAKLAARTVLIFDIGLINDISFEMENRSEKVVHECHVAKFGSIELRN